MKEQYKWVLIRGENISGFMLQAITIQHKEKKSVDPLRGNYN